MLAQYVRQQGGVLPEPSIGSSKLMDAIKTSWVEDSYIKDVTLAKKSPIWKEWWIGASSVSKACPRMFGLMCAAGPGGYKPKQFKSEDLWNFGIGKAYHRLFQEEMMPSLSGGTLLGRWKNKKTGKYTEHDNVVPEGVSVERGWGPCPDGKDWVYDESKLRIPDYRAVVKIDAILDWPDEDGLEVVEIKTEKSEAKDLLNPAFGGRPRDSHVEQVHVAMWATGIERGRIVYAFKGERYLSTSTVEHVIMRDESLLDEIRSRMKACVETVSAVEAERDRCMSELGYGDFVDENRVVRWEDIPEADVAEIRKAMKLYADEIPRCPECQMKSKGRPKYCDGRDLCFGVRKKKKK